MGKKEEEEEENDKKDEEGEGDHMWPEQLNVFIIWLFAKKLW